MSIKCIFLSKIGITIYLFLITTYIFCKVFFMKLLMGLQSIDKVSGVLKKSDTLFILGSGSSINNLSPQYWQHISQHDSVGFNFWFIHDFVPTYYVYEESSDKSRNAIFYEILEEKKMMYKDTIFLIKDIEIKNIEYYKIPQEIRHNFYLTPSISYLKIFLGKSYFYLTTGIALKFLSKINKKSIKLLMNRKASLFFIVNLAYFLGYKKVVFCGVDLNDNRYFFDDIKYSSHKKPNNCCGQNIHPTNNTLNKDPMIISDIIKKSYFSFFHNKMKLYTISEKSELIKFIPLYEIENIK